MVPCLTVPDSDLVTLPTVARECGFCLQTARNYVMRGLISARRVGRGFVVSRADVQAFKETFPHLVKAG